MPIDARAYCSYKYAVGFFGTMHLTEPCRKETCSVPGERTRRNFACISGARDDAEEAMGEMHVLWERECSGHERLEEQLNLC